jgi:hypothetical protein
VSAGDWPDELAATPEVLWRFVEQPEPTTNGDAFLVSMKDLQALGYTHVEVHFPTRDLSNMFDLLAQARPDAVTFHKVEDPE